METKTIDDAADLTARIRAKMDAVDERAYPLAMLRKIVRGAQRECEHLEQRLNESEWTA